jgi:hypothetical protein
MRLLHAQLRPLQDTFIEHNKRRLVRILRDAAWKAGKPGLLIAPQRGRFRLRPNQQQTRLTKRPYRRRNDLLITDDFAQIAFNVNKYSDIDSLIIL